MLIDGMLLKSGLLHIVDSVPVPSLEQNGLLFFQTRTWSFGSFALALNPFATFREPALPARSGRLSREDAMLALQRKS
jgi:hypothetical protein